MFVVVGLGGAEVVGDTSGEPVVRIDVILPNRIIGLFPPPLELPMLFLRTPAPKLPIRFRLCFLRGEGCEDESFNVVSIVNDSRIEERLKEPIKSAVGGKSANGP